MIEHKVIGTTEYIYLPDVSQQAFSAKIDTGADSSAIWASNISQADGKLRYTFFAPGSAYYTGEFQETDRFKITSVRNSFGHDEMRYKIRLKVTIGEHTVTRWFSLADRSRSTFPILLGKNILKNRFVVDVSQNYVYGQAPGEDRVLVITTFPKKTTDFLRDVQQKSERGVTYAVARFEDILFDINGNLTTVVDTRTDMDVADYSLTYVKSHWKYPELAGALSEYLLYKGRPFLDQELRSYTSRGKLSESMKLVTHGIAVPRSIAGYPALLKARLAYVVAQLGFPLVLKSAGADRGRDNYFVADEATFLRLLTKAQPTDIYIAQTFVENDGFYRLNVFGKDVRLAVFRSTHTHEEPLKRHLNKPPGGINATTIPLESLPVDATELAVRGAICMDRQIAGVDIIRDKVSGEWFILEVNSSPQLRSGTNIEEKMVEFARLVDKELGR